MAASSQPTTGQVALKVAGALAGTVFVESLDAPVAALRAEVARLLNLSDASGIKLIIAGKTLADDAQPLAAAGCKATSRVLTIAGAQAGAALTESEAKEARLERIQRVLNKLTNRDATSDDLPALELENQAGQKVQLKQDDRRALVQGLALHDLGKAALKRSDYEEALRLLHMSEESFALANAELLAAVDNLGMLLLDIVWCCYKLNDARRLAVAKEKLGRARAALERAYGPGLQRLKQLHGSRCPELAIYTRLEALEAVAAYHGGDLSVCEAALQQAQKHWSALQVSDLKLAQLQDMGYGGDESRRALKLSGGDMDAAITFIFKQREDDEARKQKARKEARYRKERKEFGRTPSKSYVNEEYLDRVMGLGYERPLAAQALRLLDNEVDAAVELLLNERCRELLVQVVTLMQTIKTEEGQEGGRYEQLLTANAAAALAGLAMSVKQEGQLLSDGDLLVRTHSMLESLMHHDTQPGASGSKRARADNTGGASTSSVPPPEQMNVDAAGQQGDREQEQEGDAEMEEDMRAAIQSDAMASYDLDVQEEGDIIQTFSALCASAKAAIGG